MGIYSYNISKTVMSPLLILILFLIFILLCGLAFVTIKKSKTDADKKAAANLIPTNVETTVDGAKTTTFSDGTTQTIKMDENGNATVTTKYPNKPPETRSIGDELEKMFSDPILYKALSIPIAIELLNNSPYYIEKLKYIKNTLKQSLSTVKLVEKGELKALQAGTKSISKATAKAAEAAAVEAAEKGATRAGERVTAMTGAAAATGPLFPFVEAAEIAFSVFTGYMDSFNLGGFQDQLIMPLLNGMRDKLDYMFADSFKDQDFPINYGPFEAMDSNVFIDRISQEANVITERKVTEITAKLDSGEIPKPNPITLEGFLKIFEDGIDQEEVFKEAAQNLCAIVGGDYIKHPYSSNMYCTYKKTDCNPPWPLKPGDYYYGYYNNEKMCAIKQSLMRTKCESLGFGITYNQETGSCNLTDTYCRRYGNDEGLKNGDCKASESQQIAEILFGTAFVRGIVNVFDTDNYSCPDGYSRATELSVVPGIGFASQYLCSVDRCKEGQDKINGICYDKCPEGYSHVGDGLGNKVNGMCYKCPEGYKKSTLGLCHRVKCPADHPVLENGLCYRQCPADTPESDGATLCTSKCDPGFESYAYSCTSPPDAITDSGVVAKCPPGSKTTIEGPGGMCRLPCPEGQKEYGGVCYDSAVDTGLLTKFPDVKSCNQTAIDNGRRDLVGKLRDDGTSCWEDLSCWTGWIDGKGVVTRCNGCGCIKYAVWDRKQNGCSPGYKEDAGMCYAINHGVNNKPLLEVGVCDPDRVKIDGMCYKKCPDGYERTVAGTCQLWAKTRMKKVYDRGVGLVPEYSDVMADTVGPQEPKGISYNVVPAKRKVPFPATTTKDFEQSTLGKHLTEMGDSMAKGDLGGAFSAMAASAVVGNPLVVGLGVQDLADLGLQQI
jgi:hypothetical protein